jgi:chitin disaccharide deacetylase
MDGQRWLIVNADDFGLSAGVNRGIAQAHESGIVTSTSLMTRWPDAVDAAEYAGSHKDLSLGLHVDLSEWAFRDGEWMALYEVVPLTDPEGVRIEIFRQLETFRALTGADPTHIDSHQHAHSDEPVRSAVVEIAESLGVPVRSPPHMCGIWGTSTGREMMENRIPTSLAPHR